MTKEEIIKKLKGLQTWSFDHRDNYVYKDYEYGDYVQHEDIEELINELEGTYTLKDTGDFTKTP